MSREIIRSVLEGDIKRFDLFLQEGLDINETTEKEKWNLLHQSLLLVSMPPDLKMTKHLIDCGIDVNAVDCYGNTPLHYAVRLKNAELVQMLLDAKAEIDPVNLDGVTPLREALAVKPYDLNVIETLLSHGADMNHCIEGGLTVRKHAETISHGDDAEVLEVFNKYVR